MDGLELYPVLEVLWSILELIEKIYLSHERGHVGDVSPLSPQGSTLSSHGPNILIHHSSFWPESLACLNEFLCGETVWTLRYYVETALDPAPMSPDSKHPILANIKDFASVWGPVWGTAPSDAATGYQSFRTRAGYMLPWEKSDVDISTPESGTRLCHWVPESTYLSRPSTKAHTTRASHEEDSERSSESLDASETSFVDWSRYDEQAAPFKSSDLLLIGADSMPSLEFETCHHSTSALVSDLRSLPGHRVRELNTEPLHRWNELKQFSLVGGYQATLGAQWRPETEISRWRFGIVDSWTVDPSCRHPKLFETMRGVAVSMCTFRQ